MAGFVLIHGAFHGGWCFDPVAERLRQRGHLVIAPDLPGMGGTEAELRAATLDGWGEYVVGLCHDMRDSCDGPVILVGHSRGGSVISTAAERDPIAMDQLIYVTALMTPVGGELGDLLAALNPELQTMQTAMSQVENGAGMMITPEGAAYHFAQNSPPELVERQLARLVAEPMSTFVTPVIVTEKRWGKIPRSYIECTQDNTFHIDFQRKLVELSPCNRVFTLEADHSPFYSAPDALSDALEAVARES